MEDRDALQRIADRGRSRIEKEARALSRAERKAELARRKKEKGERRSKERATNFYWFDIAHPKLCNWFAYLGALPFIVAVIFGALRMSGLFQDSTFTIVIFVAGNLAIYPLVGMWAHNKGKRVRSRASEFFKSFQPSIFNAKELTATERRGGQWWFIEFSSQIPTEEQVQEILASVSEGTPEEVVQEEDKTLRVTVKYAKDVSFYCWLQAAAEPLQALNKVYPIQSIRLH